MTGKPRVICHGLQLDLNQVIIDNDGRLVIMMPGEPRTEYYLSNRLKFTLGIDLLQNVYDSMADKIESLEDVRSALNNALVDMERKYEGRVD